MESIHYLLMKAHTLLNQQILTQAAAIGLTPGQPKILEYLMAHEGSDQKTISAYCEIKPSTTGTILAGMEAKGLVERRQVDGNRRSLYVFLTERGRAVGREMASIFDEAEGDAIRGLEKEQQEQLKTLLNQMIQTLEQGK